jgi:hypothetical protein
MSDPNRARRRFTPQQKEEAVALCLAEGLTSTAVAHRKVDQSFGCRSRGKTSNFKREGTSKCVCETGRQLGQNCAPICKVDWDGAIRISRDEVDSMEGEVASHNQGTEVGIPRPIVQQANAGNLTLLSIKNSISVAINTITIRGHNPLAEAIKIVVSDLDNSPRSNNVGGYRSLRCLRRATYVLLCLLSRQHPGPCRFSRAVKSFAVAPFGLLAAPFRKK